MKKVKEPAPHVKAAQIEKEAVRALSVDEVEEALTKSTYGGEKKPTDDIIVVPDGTPYDIVETLAEQRRYIKELGDDKEILKAECLALKEENKKYLREIDDYKKTISKMKYAHEEEVRALEDDLAEAKILNKKAGEYTSMLDADSDAFETILELAKIIHWLAKNAESVTMLIKDEVEGHI